MKHLAHVWAVLRCVGLRAYHNMELESQVFVDLGFELTAGKYPRLPKGMQFSVELHIMRNVSNIDKGGMVLLPMQDD